MAIETWTLLHSDLICVINNLLLEVRVSRELYSKGSSYIGTFLVLAFSLKYAFRCGGPRKLKAVIATLQYSIVYAVQ
jgi:hypothetical protein